MFGKNRTPLQNHCRCKVPIPARKVDRMMFEGGHSATVEPLNEGTNESVIEMGNYRTNQQFLHDEPCLEAGRPGSAKSVDTIAEGGGDGGEEDLATRAMKFSAQTPPDWELAEKHGRASGAVRMVTTKLDLSDENSYCLCCQMPVPTEAQ